MPAAEIATTTRNKGTSFLDLTAELRNTVYLHFFTRKGDTLQNNINPTNTPLEREPALLLTSRQIRAEALPIHLHETTFTAKFTLSNSRQVTFPHNRLRWCLRMLRPSNVAKIQRLELRIDSRDEDVIFREVLESMVHENPRNRWVKVHEKVGRKMTKGDVMEAYGLDALGVRPEAVRVSYRKAKSQKWRVLVKR